MAASTAATGTPATATATVLTQPNYLPSFTRLGSGVFYHEATPIVATTSDSQNSPSLVILTTWLSAKPRTISKFTEYYMKIYPGSSILLLTSTVLDFFYHTNASVRAKYAPALAVVEKYHQRDIASGNSKDFKAQDSTIIGHVFSNGGCSSLGLLAFHWYNAHQASLPVRGLILDSCPGTGRVIMGVKSMSVGLGSNPLIRLPAQLVILIMLALMFGLPEALGLQSPAGWMRMVWASSDPQYFPAEAPRLYLYSDRDTEVLDIDVEAHVAEAKGNGLVVRTVRFEGSKHVEHMRTFPDRYWGAVKALWEGRE